MNNTEAFSEWILSNKPEASDERRFPIVYQDGEGDRAEFLLTGEDRIAERVDSRLTIYRGRESGEITGGAIKGVKGLTARLLSEFSGFAFCVTEGRVSLELVFAAALLKETDEMLAMHYRKVFDRLRLDNVRLVLNGDDSNHAECGRLVRS